ncbi:hypothetical protein C8R45DRAFT_1025939 [Mycena sanguinolenta]|nr:hypothetical protein C8R45DRAFT_1025939 [Mycena sanguinolenta]
MNAPLVAPSSPSQVEDSRAKRLGRQQARFRDRGGIFVPRTHNNLLDILLGKKKHSPLKRRSRSRSLSVSPTKKSTSRGPSVGRKSGGTISKPASKRKAKTPVVDDSHDEEPVAGPSRLPDEPVKKPPRKAASSRKKVVPADDDALAESKPAPKRKGRVPKSKQPIEEDATNTSTAKPKAKRKPKASALEDPTPQDSDGEEPAANTTKPKAKRKSKAIPLEDPTSRDSGDDARPGPSKKRTTAKGSRKTDDPDAGEGQVSTKQKRSARSTTKANDSVLRAKPKARSTKDTQDDPPAPPARAQRSRAAKSRPTYAELSDDDEEEPSRSKNVAAAEDPSDRVVSAKRLGKQRAVEDVVSAEAPKVGKTKGKGKLREQEQEPETGPVKSKAKKGARKPAAEPDLPEDRHDTKGKGTGKSGDAVKPKARKRALDPAPPEVDEDNRPAKKRKAAAPQQRLEAIPEEDEEEALTSVNTPAQVQRADDNTNDASAVASASSTSKSKKRPRDKTEDVAETVQTARKRVKVSAAENETRAAPAPPAAPKKRAPVSKRSSKPVAEKAKPVRIPSKTLKENTPTSPVGKPTPVVKRRGPPKSVLEKVRAHAGTRLVADDDEPDELDFLS